MKVERSKTGLATFCESGGGMTSTGSATVVCGMNGEKLKPLFVPRGYSNGKHAIFVVRPGMYIINAGNSKAGERAVAHQILGIGTTEDPDELVTIVVAEYENGDGNVPEQLQSAVEAALAKSNCYHCHSVFYAEV